MITKYRALTYPAVSANFHASQSVEELSHKAPRQPHGWNQQEIIAESQDLFRYESGIRYPL